MSGRQIGRHVIAGRVGDHADGDVGTLVDDPNFGSGDHRATRVPDNAQYGAGRVLTQGAGYARDDAQNYTREIHHDRDYTSKTSPAARIEHEYKPRRAVA